MAQGTQLRIAPSLGELEGDPHTVWNLKPYESKEDPTVFMGVYSLNDFNTLHQHKGKRWIFWCGSDIRHLLDGYWLDDKGVIKINPLPLAAWINENCESWVENEVEWEALDRIGIGSHIGQSFMGNVDDYEISYENNGKFYASVSGNNFKLYGWDKIEEFAGNHPWATFNLYGNTVEWKSKHKNVVVHGRVSKEQMNKEIKKMQGGLRLTEFDGFSEIIAKSVLWGQYPYSLIPYPYVLTYGDDVRPRPEANIEGRDYYLKHLNRYPWTK